MKCRYALCEREGKPEYCSPACRFKDMPNDKRAAAREKARKTRNANYSEELNAMSRRELAKHFYGRGYQRARDVFSHRPVLVQLRTLIAESLRTTARSQEEA